MTHQSTTNPNTPSSGTLPQQTVSSDPSYDTPNILEHNLTFTDTHIGYGHVQTPTKVNWGHFFPSSDITPPPAANSYREKTKTQHPRKTGKRQGALKPEIAKRAAQIRRQRACWLCWLSKVPVRYTPETKRHPLTKLNNYSVQRKRLVIGAAHFNHLLFSRAEYATERGCQTTPTFSSQVFLPATCSKCLS
jgi:hypothetical protein